MENEANPRETGENAHYDRMGIEMLTMAMVYEIYRDMKYKNALAMPARSGSREADALADAVKQRL